jgi:hypothetical protein
VKRQLKKYKERISHTLYKRRHERAYGKIREIALSEDAANDAIAAALASGKPFFAGRMGSNECSICWNHVRSAFRPSVHPRSLYHAATVAAGILTRDDERFDKFASVYVAAIPFLDLAGTWDVKGMAPLLNKYGSASLRCTPLAALEPWHSYLRGGRTWTEGLKGKRVLVVHPFARSIEKQYSLRAGIKTIGDIIPEFELITLIPPVTLARQDNGKTWVANLQLLMSQVAKLDFSVAIIGCGAYGFRLEHS